MKAIENLIKDIHNLNEDPKSHYVAVIWHVSDVRSKADEMEVAISFEEAMEILHRLKQHHDCNIGINWEVIQGHIEDIIQER